MKNRGAQKQQSSKSAKQQMKRKREREKGVFLPLPAPRGEVSSAARRKGVFSSSFRIPHPSWLPQARHPSDPTSSGHLPAGRREGQDCFLPLTSYLLPLASCLLPFAHFPFPISHFPFPIAYCLLLPSPLSFLLSFPFSLSFPLYILSVSSACSVADLFFIFLRPHSAARVADLDG